MAQRYTFFMLLRATPAWLKLPRRQRAAFAEREITPLLARHLGVSLRFYDAEAFSGRCSDVAIWETDDLQAWSFLVDALRDSAFFAEPYFELLDIIPAIEDGWRASDRARKAAA